METERGSSCYVLIYWFISRLTCCVELKSALSRWVLSTNGTLQKGMTTNCMEINLDFLTATGHTLQYCLDLNKITFSALINSTLA